MTITMQQVRAALDPDEPRYAQAAQLGAAALPFLRQLIEASDPLAAKATYLAGMIDDASSHALLLRAAKSADPVVRIAAAGASRRLRGEPATEVLLGLLDDADVGVRKVALHAVRAGASSALLQRVEQLGQRDPEASLRVHAAAALQRGKESAESEDTCCESCEDNPSGDAGRYLGSGGGSIQGVHSVQGIRAAAEGGGAVGTGGGSISGQADQHRLAAQPTAAHTGQGGGNITLAAQPARSNGNGANSGNGGGSVPKPDPLLGIGTGGGDLGPAKPSKGR